MANFYTEISFAIHNISAEEKKWLEKKLEDEVIRWPQYEFAAEGTRRPLTLWIYEGEGCDLEELANLLQQFLFEFRPTLSIGFSWADTCSKPRLNSFGGGAVFITAKGQEWINLWEWLGKRGIE